MIQSAAEQSQGGQGLAGSDTAKAGGGNRLPLWVLVGAQPPPKFTEVIDDELARPTPPANSKQAMK